jgi:hypothetical protein
MTENKRLPLGSEKHGGYSGGTSADKVKPPAKLPSGSIKAPKAQKPQSDK